MTPSKVNRTTANRAARGLDEATTLQIVSNLIGAVCILLAFTYAQGTEQLLIVSVRRITADGRCAMKSRHWSRRYEELAFNGTPKDAAKTLVKEMCRRSDQNRPVRVGLKPATFSV